MGKAIWKSHSIFTMPIHIHEKQYENIPKLYFSGKCVYSASKWNIDLDTIDSIKILILFFIVKFTTVSPRIGPAY
jgi:hypothetical protein